MHHDRHALHEALGVRKATSDWYPTRVISSDVVLDKVNYALRTYTLAKSTHAELKVQIHCALSSQTEVKT